jgi:hypothetical protein
MKTDSSPCAECPSSEVLSSWYDRELRNPEIDEHLAVCKGCQKVIAAYQSIDNVLTAGLSTDRRDVIIRSVIKQSGRPSILHFPMYKVSIAAGLAVVAVTLFIALNQMPLTPGTGLAAELDDSEIETEIDLAEAIVEPAPMIAATRGPDHSTVEPPPMPFAVARSTSPAPAPREPRFHSTEAATATGGIADLRLVNFDPDSRNTRDITPRRRSIPASDQKVVEDFVRHIWLVDETVAPLEALKTYTESDGQLLVDLIARDSDRYLLQMVLTDKDLQSLVNRFHDLRFKLLSPDAPQPGIIQTLNFSGKPVKYEMDIVRKN